ncbi:ATP-binding protein [Halodesulfovibrio marinisediminis]|uniref:Serine/threonine-protein kinase RsbW n=1 Tax=Halodesulfovibrio marinisediminis DSM 17456 TaxID=1121457 RepID=A0A1N6HAS3_9BACT|nr:ATP-binding protein [Halodesulfovibrio marinisediminis]SIO16745.1 serine/threonine-protein kinase RsbW [Halodesulfovibrio marinisediminis DSM 17456]
MNNTRTCYRVIIHSRDEFIQLVSAIDKMAEKHSIASSVVFKITLALDELISNIFDYAFNDTQKPEIDIVVCIDRGVFFAKIIDSGKAFDISKIQKPELDKPIDKRRKPIGGMGVHLVRNLMDSFTYYRVDGKNYVLICTKIDTETH